MNISHYAVLDLWILYGVFEMSNVFNGYSDIHFWNGQSGIFLKLHTQFTSRNLKQRYEKL
jgi:hypothetical protein